MAAEGVRPSLFVASQPADPVGTGLIAEGYDKRRAGETALRPSTNGRWVEFGTTSSFSPCCTSSFKKLFGFASTIVIITCSVEGFTMVKIEEKVLDGCEGITMARGRCSTRGHSPCTPWVPGHMFTFGVRGELKVICCC